MTKDQRCFLPTRLLFFLGMALLVISLHGPGREATVAVKTGDISTTPANKLRQSGYRWGLMAIRAPRAWDISRGSGNITVAIVDSGVNIHLPAISSRIWRNTGEIPSDGIDNDGNGFVDDLSGWDFADNDPDVTTGSEYSTHGTFVACLLASALDRNTGAGGVAPEISIMDLRVLNSKGELYSSHWHRLVRALRYAVVEGADIINLSVFPVTDPPNFVLAAIEKAIDAGIIVVTIPPSGGHPKPSFSSIEGVITVGAVGKDQNVGNIYGPPGDVDIVAPGMEVLSLDKTGVLAIGSGDSYAAPHVSGTAGLLLSIRPDLTQSELREILVGTARRESSLLGFPGYEGALLDSAAAVKYVSGE